MLTSMVHIDIETTSLILACKESRKDIVNLLLQSGADPNLQTDTGLTVTA